MSAARASLDDATNDARGKRSQPRIPVDRARFRELCAARGAHDDHARAALLHRTRKQVWQYENGLIPPGLLTARDIADRLGVHPDELWPYTPKAAA